jgi:hypothetical protein
MNKFWALLGLCFVACATTQPPAYRTLIDNHLALKRTPMPSVAVGTFSAQLEYEPLCRLAAHIEPSPSVETYVRNALVHELTLANLISGTASATLHGELTDAAFESDMSGAFWRLGLRLRSSNGRSLAVVSRAEFPTAFFVNVACDIVADKFMSTVQLLVRDVLMSPDFPALLAPGQPSDDDVAPTGTPQS